MTDTDGTVVSREDGPPVETLGDGTVGATGAWGAVGTGATGTGPTVVITLCLLPPRSTLSPGNTGGKRVSLQSELVAFGSP